jgi:hypothetical protein
MSEKGKNILFRGIIHIIEFLGMTCGSCKHYKTINCGIVCDHCAIRDGRFETANLAKYFCRNYESDKRIIK